MSSLVVESDPSYQEEESLDDSSSKDSQSDLKQSGSSDGEGPLSNDVVGDGDGDGEDEGDGPEEVDSTVVVAAVASPATVSSMTITLAEAPVPLRSNNGRVGEATAVPLRSNNGRVAEATAVPLRSNNSRVGEATVSTSVVRVPPEKRSLYKFGQRTSNFRGVTRHRWTGKYEAHLWDNSTITEGRKRKGKQVYLGGYETEEKAAQIYDLAALKYWGPTANTKLNFPASNYERELEEMKGMSREEYVNSLRRNSICFTRGCSIYRGVTRQNVGRRWQARIGRVAGGKDIYLGTYDTEEEAAEAYDIAAVKLRGMNAITNFDISNYYKEGTKELDVIPIKNMEEEPSGVKIRYFKLK